MSKVIWKVMLLVLVVVMLGTASKLKTARKISVSGAVSGSANFDGSGNVTITTTQANIAVLSGSINIPASDTSGSFNGSATTNISYPSGFTKDNCQVISISTALPAQGIYSTGNVPKYVATDLQKGMIPAYVTKNSSNLTLKGFNATTSQITINYKIVLMKVS